MDLIFPGLIRDELVVAGLFNFPEMPLWFG